LQHYLHIITFKD